MSATATQEAKKPSVTEYLGTLVWDGTPRIDRWLVDYAGAEDSPYVRAVSRAMLVAAVRRVRHPGCRFDQMPILEGPQGSGKTSALRILAICDDWFADDVPLAGPSQELIEATAGKWIVELAELRRMSAGDVAALKAQLSIQEDVVRRQPYQREGASVPRQFVIVGTTGATDYLRDPTGNRRFWTARIERFDLDRLRADRDQLWAEAAVVEALGETILVPTEAQADVTDIVEPDQLHTNEERTAYVVINDLWGVEFSTESLDIACTFVSDKLRAQAMETTLNNPSSYRIKRVKAG